MKSVCTLYTTISYATYNINEKDHLFEIENSQIFIKVQLFKNDKDYVFLQKQTLFWVIVNFFDKFDNLIIILYMNV